MASKVPLISLNNGMKIAQIGLGTMRLSGQSGKDAVKCAIDLGYRHFDTAFLYGNEVEVGEAIREKITEGVITRDEIFIVTKLWGIHHTKVEEACRSSLKKLGLEIDLYLMHFPVGYIFRDDAEKWPQTTQDILDIDYLEVWQEMEKLVNQGLVRGIGISNFNSLQIDRLLKNCKIPPAALEIECSPGLSNHKLIDFCKEKGIAVTGYCPLGRHNPEKQLPNFLYNEKTSAIAKKYGKTPAQVASRYTLQLGAIPIPKSGNPERLKENFEIFDFVLSEEDMQTLQEFHDPQNRVCKFEYAASAKYYPFDAEF